MSSRIEVIVNILTLIYFLGSTLRRSKPKRTNLATKTCSSNSRLIASCRLKTLSSLQSLVSLPPQCLCKLVRVFKTKSLLLVASRHLELLRIQT